jgi:TIR domain
VPGRVFVTYRRDDERAMAARIRDRLAASFGNAKVFMDVDNLLAGQRFDRELEKALGHTDVSASSAHGGWTYSPDARRALCLSSALMLRRRAR